MHLPGRRVEVGGVVGCTLKLFKWAKGQRLSHGCWPSGQGIAETNLVPMFSVSSGPFSLVRYRPTSGALSDNPTAVGPARRDCAGIIRVGANIGTD
jgi:hypothetical protein